MQPGQIQFHPQPIFLTVTANGKVGMGLLMPYFPGNEVGILFYPIGSKRLRQPRQDIPDAGVVNA